ncbi:MAG: glycosyltransferase family 2 protein [Frankiaceae bacterium]
MRQLPSVGVIVPTRGRPAALRAALEALGIQTYRGPLEIVVVYDRCDPDPSLARDSERPVRVLTNSRTPGLSGARNTGILALGTDLVAFCDDDDVWRPEKLQLQVAALTGRPHRFSTTAIEVSYRGRLSVRQARRREVSHDDLIRSRMSMLHSSTFVAWRPWLVTVVGLLDETAPDSQNEDWDLLLRVTEHGPVAHVDDPLVRVHWGAASYFARQWETRASACEWILGKHADISTSREGAARVYGQLAFARAALGQRRQCRTWAARALRSNPRQWRAIVALVVAAGVISPDRVLDFLHRFGRGV